MAKKAPGAELGQAMPSITKDKSTAPEPYETEGHLSTLMKAHEIMNNPVHLKAVHELAGRHQGAIKSIQDIKNYSNNKFGSKNTGVGALKNNDENEEPADQGNQV